mgnify:CR=1 FL=1
MKIAVAIAVTAAVIFLAAALRQAYLEKEERWSETDNAKATAGLMMFIMAVAIPAIAWLWVFES